MLYLKLGAGASIFFDPTSQLLIRNNEVVALERPPKTKKYGLASRNGHIVSTSKEEYDNFLKSTGKVSEKFIPTPTAKASKKEKPEVLDEYEYNPELLIKTPNEIREMVINEGFLEEDIEKFNGMEDIKEMIKLYDILNKEYA